MPDQQWRPKANPWLIALAVIVPTFMEVLDTSIAAVALPNIAGNLSASIDEATWVLTSYLVANAIVLPASGWLALRFGRRRFLLFCIVVFTVSSFFCGAATSLGMILAARALQGAGGGALQPLSQAILLESFPPAKRGAAMAIFALGVVVAPVLGPTLGGYLTDQYSWRWAFYINIPIGVLAVFMVSRFVEDPPYISSAKPGRFDGIGLGLLIVWLGALQIVLDKGQEDDWFGATWIRWAVALAATAFVAFLVQQWRDPHPITNLRVFKDRNFALGCLVMTLFGGVIYGLVSILPLFYQTVMGYSARSAGLAVSPRGIGAVCIMPVIAYLTSRVDTRWLIAIGFLGFAGSAIWMSQLTLNISQWSLLTPIILSGACSGMVFVPPSHYRHGDAAQRNDRQRQRPVQPPAQCRRQRRNFRGEHPDRPPPTNPPRRTEPLHHQQRTLRFRPEFLPRRRAALHRQTNRRRPRLRPNRPWLEPAIRHLFVCRRPALYSRGLPALHPHRDDAKKSEAQTRRRCRSSLIVAKRRNAMA